MFYFLAVNVLILAILWFYLRSKITVCETCKLCEKCPAPLPDYSGTYIDKNKMEWRVTVTDCAFEFKANHDSLIIPRTADKSGLIETDKIRTVLTVEGNTIKLDGTFGKQIFVKK